MANVGPTLWFCRDNSTGATAGNGTIGWSSVTQWAALTAVAAGVLCRQTTAGAPAIGNERVFVCIIAGTTLSAEPTWVLTKGAKTAETAGPTWQECTGQPGVNGDATDSPTWTQNKNTAVTLGLIIYDSVSASLQIVSTAGTTGNGAQPSFSATAGVTTSDNTVTWTSLGLASGFGVWAAPFARVQSAIATNWMIAGNSLFVGDDHAETQATAETITFPGTLSAPNYAYSIDHAGSVTLLGATLKSGASVTTTGNSALTIQGSGLGSGFATSGFTYSAGSGAVAAGVTYGNSNVAVAQAINCAFVKAGTSAGAALTLGRVNASVRLVNCTYQVGNVSDQLAAPGDVIWTNTPNAIQGATLPTNLIATGTSGIMLIIDGVDLSALGSGKTIFPGGNATGRYLLKNSKLGSGVTVAGTPSGSATVDVINCDSAGTNYIFQRYWEQGTQIPETVLVRTGGASNGVTALSSKATTTANSNWTLPFSSQPIAIYNTITGTNRGVTLYGIYNGTAIPNNDDIWIEAEYFGSASSPQASFANNTKANNLATGSALTADSTSVWTSLVTARQNSYAYSVGAVMVPIANTRAFFCTTAGTSAGSEPGGYASAVDGGSVTDGGAVFRAGWRFSLAVTLSSPQPAMAGPIYVTVNAAKVSSTYWVDPLINLS